MKKLLLFIFLCIPLLVLAQQEDSISLHQYISQDRKTLLDKFRAGRLDSVSLLLDSIDHYHDIPLLWPAERLLLYFWIERYHDIDSLSRHIDTDSMEISSNHPAEQVIWNVLSSHSFENRDMLVSWIDLSGCDDREFDFRVWLLETMILGDWNDQVSINREISSFVNRFLHDDEETSQEMMQMNTQTPKLKRDNHSSSLGFGFGLGPTSVSGRFADYFSTRTGLSFDFNVYHKRWYFTLLMQPIFAKVKRDIPVGNGDDVWEAGKMAIIGNFDLGLGYSVVDNRLLMINPFIGLSFSECSPSEQQIEENEALADATIRLGFTCMYGINTAFKLYNIIDRLNNDFPISFNLRMNYIPAMFKNVNPRYAGNMFFVTLGVNIELHSW